MDMLSGIPIWVILLAILTAGLITVPVLTGYASSTPQSSFIGFEFKEDFQAYAGYIESGVSGNPFFLQDKSTSEPQEGRYVILYFSILALIVKATHLSIDGVWNAARFLVLIILLLMFWKLFSRVMPRAETRNSAYILLALGGGLGWIVPVLGQYIPALNRLYSTDLTYAIGYTFFGFAFHPLAMFGMIFFVGMVLFLLDFWEHEKEREIMGAVACALLAFFNHPAGGVVAWLVLGIVLLYHMISRHQKWFSWKTLEVWAPPLVGGLIILFYTWWARQDPVYLFHQSYYLEWARQEPLIGYVFGLGLPLFFAGLALVQKRPFELTSKGARGVFFAWLFIALGLSFFLPAGVKYLYLVWPALAFFAALDFAVVAHQLEYALNFIPWKTNGWIALFLIVSCLSAPFLVEKRIEEVAQPSYFVAKDVGAGLDFLATQPAGIVLSDFENGSLISWRTPSLPYVAHGFLTIDFKEKRDAVANWLNTETPLEEKKALLAREHISYVFVGPDEAKLGMIDPALGLSRIFTSGNVAIYRVPGATN